MTDAAHAVLVIDDEPQLRRLLRTTLVAEGFRVIEAETAQRGLIEAASHRPDLVILDLGLPDAGGQTVVAGSLHGFVVEGAVEHLDTGDGRVVLVQEFTDLDHVVMVKGEAISGKRIGDTADGPGGGPSGRAHFQRLPELGH